MDLQDGDQPDSRTRARRRETFVTLVLVAALCVIVAGILVGVWIILDKPWASQGAGAAGGATAGTAGSAGAQSAMRPLPPMGRDPSVRPVVPGMALPLDETAGKTADEAAAAPVAPKQTKPPAAGPAPLARPVTPAVPEAPHPTLVARVSSDRTLVNDANVEASIRRGVGFLLGKVKAGKIENIGNDSEGEGKQALIVYALLQAGISLHDENLLPTAEPLATLITQLKAFPMDGDRATYSRSLRIAALCSHNRPEDRATIEADLKWTLRASVQGSYGYSMPEVGKKAENFSWDNSNSQYGALGAWAAQIAGYEIPTGYWAEVATHWQDTQGKDGGWGYHKDDEQTAQMTAAGVNMMFLSADLMGENVLAKQHSRSAMVTTIERGLSWLATERRVAVFTGHFGYTMYSVERAGLASGRKYFGDADWYRELAKRALESQSDNGSWPGGDGEMVDTPFAILFLSRGRPPVLMSKLRYTGDNPQVNWQRMPRDAANLAHYATKQTERQLNWQVVDADRDWQNWTDSPVLLMTGNRPPELDEVLVAKLKSYCLAGGMLFTHADGGSDKMDAFAAELAGRLTPHGALADIPAGHPIYNIGRNTKADDGTYPHLQGLTVGSRLWLVHSPDDITNRWIRRPGVSVRRYMDTGLNVGLYAISRVTLRNRIDTPYISRPAAEPSGTATVVRVVHSGEWDPEPMAWRNFSNQWQTNTGLAVKTTDTAHTPDLNPTQVQLAHLTSHSAFTLAPDEAARLKGYVEAGGVLLADVTGGDEAVAADVKAAAATVAGQQLTELQPGHPALKGQFNGMSDWVNPAVTPFASDMGRRKVHLYGAKVGKGWVIYSPLDLTTGLLGTTPWNVAGVRYDNARSLAANLLIWQSAGCP